MNTAFEQTPQPTITLTKAAQQQVSRLLEKENNPNVKLRIYIIGGGCSGFQYGFKLDSSVSSDDIIIQSKLDSDDTVKSKFTTEQYINIIIDALSFQYLMGSEIDYIINLQGAKYSVKNPNAETTCGCGSSFSLKE